MRERHKEVPKGEFRECASVRCMKIFPSGEGSGAYCSRTCQRADLALSKNVTDLHRALAVMERLDQYDIYDVVGRRKIRETYAEIPSPYKRWYPHGSYDSSPGTDE